MNTTSTAAATFLTTWSRYQKYDPYVEVRTFTLDGVTYEAAGERGGAMTVRPVQDDPQAYPDSVTVRWEEWDRVAAYYRR